MTKPALVVVGGSAGSVEALQILAAGLPRDLAAAVAVVLHVSPVAESRLAEILARAGPLPAERASDGRELEAGRIYVAPPDRHLLIEDGRMRVVRGPRENLARPAIDPLFRSAAAVFGPRVVAVVLSGVRDDGAAGVGAVRRAGGRVVVQDPAEAAFPGMPQSALAADGRNHVLPLDGIADAVASMVTSQGALPEEAEMSDHRSDEMSLETSYAAFEAEAIEYDEPAGALTPFACPSCGGSLWETEKGGLPRFRCRIGHAFGADSDLEEQSHGLDRALETALRALLERASLAERIARRARTTGSGSTARRFEKLAREAHDQAAVIRGVLLRRDAPAG